MCASARFSAGGGIAPKAFEEALCSCTNPIRAGTHTDTRAPLIDTAPYAPHILSIVRIVIALLFFEHGLSKMVGFPAETLQPFLTLDWIAGAIEFVGGALLAVGLLSRFCGFLMSGEMAFAYFVSHAPHGFLPIVNRGDGAILYCFIFLYISFAGPGP
jgi:putative oxidoreductase